MKRVLKYLVAGCAAPFIAAVLLVGLGFAIAFDWLWGDEE